MSITTTTRFLKRKEIRIGNGHLVIQACPSDQSVTLTCFVPGRSSDVGSIQGAPTCGLVSLQVHPFFQRKGIGEMLLRRYIKWVRDHTNHTQVTLTCNRTNTAAIALYTKVGFTMSPYPEGDGILGDTRCTLALC